MLNERIASSAVLNEAYDWLCARRINYPAKADIWSFRRDWRAEQQRIQNDLLAGRYRFDTQQRVALKDGSEIDVWRARDALVLKAMTICLGEVLRVSSSCVHVKGHGGAKHAVRAVLKTIPAHQFVMRTDVKSYYASIDHLTLLDHLAIYVDDRDVLNLLAQYLKRTAERGGSFYDYERGISPGCALSPLLGALFLDALDRCMERSGLFYVRYMDDILVLAPSRWKLRKAVNKVNQVLAGLGLQKHPDKTFIGRVALRL